MKNNEDREAFLKRAKEGSIGVSRTERNTRTYNVDVKRIKAKIIAILMSGALIVGGVTFVKAGIDRFNSPTNMSNMSREIGAIVNQVDGPDEMRYISIVSQNTHRNANGPYYSQEDIAKDLLRLDSRIFDYAFCTVCEDMGEDINNKVGVNGLSNIDSVVYYLKELSKNGTIVNDYVSNEFRDVESLEKYLVKYGYVDKDGKASLDKFKKACDEKAESILEIVNESKEKGASLS